MPTTLTATVKGEGRHIALDSFPNGTSDKEAFLDLLGSLFDAGALRVTDDRVPAHFCVSLAKDVPSSSYSALDRVGYSISVTELSSPTLEETANG